jgi:hypothetical protein
MIDATIDRILKKKTKFTTKKDKENFKKYYLYHILNQEEFPITDKEFKPEFREIRLSLPNRDDIEIMISRSKHLREFLKSEESDWPISEYSDDY